jgi:uncharacterized membrane protein YkvA (DUF1232 family)
MTNIFISHDWDDKTFADKLASDLKGVGKIWIDSKQTKPGEIIADDVDAGLRQSDVVLVLWSQHAARSTWVPKEASFAIENEKHVIPLYLDESRPDGPLGKILGIPAADWRQDYAKVFLRVNLAIARCQSQALDQLGVELDLDELFDKFDDVDGVINYVSDYCRERGVEMDADHWVRRVGDATATAQTERTRIARMQDADARGQEYTDRIGKALNNPTELEKILKEVAADEQLTSTHRSELEKGVKEILSHFSERGSGASTPLLPGSPHETYRARRIREQIRTAIARDSKLQRLDGHLRGVFRHYRTPCDDKTLRDASDLIIDYIGQVPELLDALAGAAAAKGKTKEVEPLLDLVADYFAKSDDLMPDTVGVYGLFDDAYLVFAVLQEVNQRIKADFGHRLIDNDFGRANQWIEWFIGKARTAKLKEDVDAEISRLKRKKMWKAIGTVALGGLALYGLSRIASGAGARPGAHGLSSGGGGGRCFEDEAGDFFARHGLSMP